MFRRYSLLFAVILGFVFPGYAQKPDLADPSVLMNLLQMESTPLDPDAKALYVYNKGKSTAEERYSRYRQETIIKVLHNDAAQEFGTILIPRSAGVKVEELKATVYNLEHGQIQTKSIHKKELVKEMVTDDLEVIKVFLPEVKKGSVIAYEFEQYSRRVFFLRTEWYFQEKYPSLHSEYEADIAPSLYYSPIIRINSDLVQASSKKDLERSGTTEVYRDSVVEVSLSNDVWIRRNVPAFKEEPFMASPDNYREKVKLHIRNYAAAKGSSFKLRNNTWRDVCANYYYQKHFAKPSFEYNPNIGEVAYQLTSNLEEPRQKAKRIYQFIRDSIQSYRGADANRNVDIKNVLSIRSGSNYERNLLLVALLRCAELKAFPVMLSTTKNERLNPEVPDPSNINFMVTLLCIGKDSIYLDPSNKYVPFGTLTPQCLNGYAPIISSKAGGSELLPSQFEDNNTIMVHLSHQEESKQLLARVDLKFGWISSYLLRNQWDGDTSKVRKYLDNHINSNYELKSIKGNFSAPDERLLVQYELVKDWEDASMIYVDPYVEKLIYENPFPDVARQFPIELPYLRDVQYFMTYELPAGFKPEESINEEKTWMLNEQKDLILITKTTFDADQHTIKVYSRYTENEYYIPADQYPSLRNFFTGILEEQNRKIVLKNESSSLSHH